MTTDRRRPVFKWAGGKFRLLDEILPELAGGKRLVEPFVGSGTVFLNAAQTECLLCDLNRDLVEFHQALRNEGREFVARCRALFTPEANARDPYLRRRDLFNRLPFGTERAALFLYLNRHGYNGLVRYNSGGGFNVPFGRHASPRFPREEMHAFLDRMRGCRLILKCQDFRATMAETGDGDVVYCDPPYIPLSDTASFTGYAGKSFGPGEQADLARLAGEAAKRGARVLLSNHAGDGANELYRDADSVREVAVRRSISCNGGKRGVVREVLAIYQ